jgi:hypothetical protein
MRTSGGRGAEGWIVVIPIAALMVAMTMTNGGAHETVLTLERMFRETLTSAVAFVQRLF